MVIVAVMACLTAAAPASAVTGFLELPPGPVSGRQGIGGWVCDATTVEVEIDGVKHVVPYGTTRADTAILCGDDDNGFFMVIDWNEVGDGAHVVRALADGAQIGSPSTVQVTTLGVPFLAGPATNFLIADFPPDPPGNDTTISWNPDLQNFVVVSFDATRIQAATAGEGLLSPTNGAPLSGILPIIAIVCDGTSVTAEFDGGAEVVELAYGFSWPSAAGVCGASDLGAGALYNFNRLGDGLHSMRLLVDGNELASASFTVTTIGSAFIAGLSRQEILPDFPSTGLSTVVEWTTPRQNFTIVSAFWERITAAVGGGGSATTDSEGDGATSDDPVETAVTTPIAGDVTISEGQLPVGDGFAEFTLLGQTVNIDAPAATAEAPLVIDFVLDASLVPGGLALADLTAFRDGLRVEDCSGVAGHADPDPCTSSKTTLPDGDLSLTVHTSAASAWNLAIPNPPRVDHLVGYAIAHSKVEGNDLPKRWVVTLDDAVLPNSEPDDPENFEVKKAKTLLSPAMKNDEPGPENPELHYLHYQLVGAKEGHGAQLPNGRFPRAAKHEKRIWDITNQFGEIRLESKKVAALLVPSGKSLAGPATAPADATHFLCYAVKATSDVTTQTPDAGKGKGTFRKDMQAFFLDQFDDCATDREGNASFAGTAVEGKCLYDLKSPNLLCNPAAKRAVEAPRGTAAVITESVPDASESLVCYHAKAASKVVDTVAVGLAAVEAGAKIRQEKHEKRLLKNGDEVSVAPGNQFPAPTNVDTKRTALVCLPSQVVGVTRAE